MENKNNKNFVGWIIFVIALIIGSYVFFELKIEPKIQANNFRKRLCTDLYCEYEPTDKSWGYFLGYTDAGVMMGIKYFPNKEECIDYCFRARRVIYER
ncbi:MAG: hypothetical protein PHV78_01690 [Patescibacteria group bacterium]|nr:hypothetical protein [Patescibacteria group bacterium]MDD5121137.1 hypothetical protein [Patescibacteria group bacterium]MDD5221652.1 hypothetical protein [Patescibacteria group bacterium]MDD5395944.1 hypothetical protein [Patescibacteria group bacterium]